MAVALKSSEKIYSNQGNPTVIFEIKRLAQAPCNILDLGCGNGDLARFLKKFSHHVEGVTISEKEYDIAKKVLDHVYVYNLENGLPDDVLKNQYEIILCSHILEHICYPNKLLLDIKSVLSANGHVVVCLPNILHYKSRLELLKGNFNYADVGLWDHTHFKWYTFASAEKLFLENGFKVKHKYVTGEMPFGRILKFVPKNIKNKIFFYLTKISPGFFGDQLVFILNK